LEEISSLDFCVHIGELRGAIVLITCVFEIRSDVSRDIGVNAQENTLYCAWRDISRQVYLLSRHHKFYVSVGN